MERNKKMKIVKAGIKEHFELYLQTSLKHKKSEFLGLNNVQCSLEY